MSEIAYRENGFHCSAGAYALFYRNFQRECVNVNEFRWCSVQAPPSMQGLSCACWRRRGVWNNPTKTNPGVLNHIVVEMTDTTNAAILKINKAINVKMSFIN